MNRWRSASGTRRSVVAAMFASVAGATILLIWLAPNAAATSYSWSCNQSSCSWYQGFTGDNSPLTGCSTNGYGGSDWNHNTPTTSSGQVVLFSYTDCTSGSHSQSKNVWAGLDSPQFAAWKSSGTYSITIKYLIIANFATSTLCQAYSTATSQVTLQTYINAYDYTTASAPQAAVASTDIVNINAACPGGNGNPQEASIALDATYTQTSPSYFSWTQNDNIGVIGGVQVYTDAYQGAASLADLQQGSTAGVTDSAYLTYISVS